MKRIRLSTLMLWVIIAALSSALAIQSRKAARLETELQGLRPVVAYDPLWKPIPGERFWSPEDVVIGEGQ